MDTFEFDYYACCEQCYEETNYFIELEERYQSKSEELGKDLEEMDASLVVMTLGV